MTSNDMRYQLITSKGVEMRFYVLKMAELYQTLYGGTIIDLLELNPKVVALRRVG